MSSGPYPQPRCSLCEHMHGLPVGSGCYVDGCVCYTPPPVWKRHRNEGQTWCRRSGAGVASQDYIDGVPEPFCPICGRQAPTQAADRAGSQELCALCNNPLPPDPSVFTCDSCRRKT